MGRLRCAGLGAAKIHKLRQANPATGLHCLMSEVSFSLHDSCVSTLRVGTTLRR
jgi:hypothetical protein